MAKSNNAAAATVVVSPNRKPLHEMREQPRDEQRASVRVKFREGAGQKVIAGQLVRARAASDDGWVTLAPVYESDVSRIQACVLTDEDRALWQSALSAHKRKLDKWISKWVDADETPESAEKTRREAIQTYPGSPEAEFFSVTGNGRGLPPFEAVEVVETGIAPPRTEAERQTAALIDRLMANGMGAGGGSDPRVETLQADNDKLRGAVAELTKAVADLRAELGVTDDTAKSKGRK